MPNKSPSWAAPRYQATPEQDNQILENLKDLTFVKVSEEAFCQTIRQLLVQAQPIVETGYIQSIKKRVAKALELPFEVTKVFATEHFWALHESWTYVHWNGSIETTPPHRLRMRRMLEELRDTGPWPYP